jgi:hypothetical protein
MSHNDAEGLWQQSRETPTPGTEGKSLPDTYTFKYEGGLVTLRLLSISPVSWQSADGVYALNARWDGDVLQYLAPLGQWTELATFLHGRFVVRVMAPRGSVRVSRRPRSRTSTPIS